MKTKDFLFFNYNWVPNSTFIFESFRKMGHEIDIIGEEELRNFQPDCKYKNVVLYLHEGWSIPITNHIIDNWCQDSFLIQHDDTDFEQLQKWSNRTPDLLCSVNILQILIWTMFTLDTRLRECQLKENQSSLSIFQ